MEILHVTRIEREAKQAANQFTCINAACPYPFYTDAGKAFKEFFEIAQSTRAQAAAKHIAKKEIL